MAAKQITKRIDAITGIADDRKVNAPPCPRSVKIELTSHCDLKCWFCATSHKLRPKGEMDWDLYCRLIREFKESGVEELGMFYLGESLLYKRLPEAIAEAKKVGIEYVFLTTNGRLADEDKTRPLMEAGLDSLKFSFNYADAEQFKDVTGVNAFDRVFENLKTTVRVRDEVNKETGHHCGVYASSILYDGEQQEKMAETVEQITPYVDQHYFLPLYSQAGLTAGERNTKPTPGNMGRVGNLRSPLPCWALFTEARVTYDGFLSACCFDHDGRFHMGDLTKMNFLEAWNSQNFQALREAHLACDVDGTVCEKCVAFN